MYFCFQRKPRTKIERNWSAKVKVTFLRLHLNISCQASLVRYMFNVEIKSHVNWNKHSTNIMSNMIFVYMLWYMLHGFFLCFYQKLIHLQSENSENAKNNFFCRQIQKGTFFFSKLSLVSFHPIKARVI